MTTYYRGYSAGLFLLPKWRGIRFKRTDAFRPPKKGEWYLSGAVPEAYKAPNDLGQAFRIMQPVRVERIETPVRFREIETVDI